MWAAQTTCPCGRPFPLVSPTITRDSDYLLTADGRIFSPRAINQVLKNKTSFKACQFIQYDLRNLEIRVVPADRSAGKEAEAVRKSLQGMLGTGLAVTVCFADEPYQRASGKIPLIVSTRATKPEEAAG
jgi:phenylacetate-CoA ligase